MIGSYFWTFHYDSIFTLFKWFISSSVLIPNFIPNKWSGASKISRSNKNVLLGWPVNMMSLSCCAVYVSGDILHTWIFHDTIQFSLLYSFWPWMLSFVRFFKEFSLTKFSFKLDQFLFHIRDILSIRVICKEQPTILYSVFSS